VYWNPDIPNHYGPQGNPTNVYILWALAGLVLLIACSNFITLSVAESSGRAMEVGLRKVMGAKRVQVIQQFWSEALLLSFLGLLLGVALAEILLPMFNGSVHRNLTLAYFEDGFLLLVLLGVVGLIAGSYPAVVLSRFQPVSAMKGESRIGGRSRLTRTLIILQYAASITLIIGTGVILQQQDYMRNKDLGFNKEQLAVFQARVPPFSSALGVAKTYKQEILKDPRIAGVTISDRILIDGYSYVGYKGDDGTEHRIRLIGVDKDYLSTLEIPLVDGRNFSEDYPSDRDKAVLINETLAKQLGMENPVGKTLTGFRWENLMKDPVERLDQQYRNEVYWFQVLSYSALVVIALSCLGLFGLASLAVARRTKEVGIRKVLGASVGNVMWLLSRDFVKLLLLANVIAWPVAYWAMNEWLTNFAYRIELGVDVFVLAGALTLAIALLTVNVQTMKAARSNPVDALRYE
jgi:putative ABC transport system permease protein